MATLEPLDSRISPNRIGYARVSSVGQNLNSQLDALEKSLPTKKQVHVWIVLAGNN